MWILWIGMVLVWAGGLPAGYVWYGKILGIVKKEGAKKIGIAGMSLVVIGIILTFLDSISLETTVKAFKIGYVIMGIGSIMLLWAMMPGHILP